jgi:hypothetical protein
MNSNGYSKSTKAFHALLARTCCVYLPKRIDVPDKTGFSSRSDHVQIAAAKSFFHFLVVFEPLRFLVGDRRVDKPQGIDGGFH